MPEQIERRLTTIMAADVAEYTRLMRADEEGTFSALTDCRTIVEALIARHRGRVANTAGDSLLADFPSVVEGLSCALTVQQAINESNRSRPSGPRMLFRIGLHLGDVLVYRWLAAALGQAGRVDEAREALAKAIAIAPTSFDLYVRHRAPWHRPEDYAHMLEGLRKAGWQG